MNLPAFDPLREALLADDPMRMASASDAAARNPLEALYCAEFERWMQNESRGPRSAGFERAWERALLAPARHTLGEGGKCFRARLTQAAWELAGGAPGAMPIRLPLVVEVLHAGSLIVDDIQDESQYRRGKPTLHRLVGTALAINTGNLMYCWALELLPGLDLPPAIELALHRRIANAMLRCHHGQGLDLSVRISEMPQHLVPTLVQTTTRLKAGALMELAALLGAVGAGASEEDADVIGEFGLELGCGLQMLDDLSGVLNPSRRHKAIEDVGLARPTWNWAWLARDLSASRFGRLQRRASRARGDREVEALIDEIANLLRSEGKARVHQHLQQALSGLHERFGACPALALFEAELARLEDSYV